MSEQNKETLSLKIKCNTAPLELFVNLLKQHFEASHQTLKPSDLPVEIARVESDPATTSAGELGIVFYPSDALLCFAATLFAGEFHFNAVKIGHV